MKASEMMDIVLAALIVRLREENVDKDICTQSLYPGDSVPLDYAECGGMAWVRLVSAHPTSSFPDTDSSLRNCTSTLALSMEIGVMRTAPLADVILGADIDLPSEAENIETTKFQIDDMELMYSALQLAAKDIDFLIVGSYTPNGPIGGTVGGSWSFTMGSDL